MKISNRLTTITDLLLLEILAVIVVSYCFRGATSTCDGFMHLSKIKILLDSLRSHCYFPRWNPYWYFGVPMWRIYSPLSYYIMAFLGWIFNLSLLDVINLWGYLVFSIASLSMYLFAKEIQIGRFGSFASSVLFLTSANLIVYWGMGSYPNVTGVALSPMALLLFLRAAEKKDVMNTIFAGLFLSLVILTYLMNAMILFVFMSFISAVLILQKPSPLYARRETQVLFKHGLILLKNLLSITLIAGILSMWWALPFLTTYLNAPTVPDATEPLGSLADHLSRILGFDPNIYSPGIGQIILAIIGCVFIFLKYRRSRFIIALICFLVALFFSFTPWLHIPTGPFYWWRFSSYLSLFAALCGGILLEHLKNFYEEILSRSQLARPKKRRIVKIFSAGVSTLVLLASIYPVVGSREIVFTVYNISKIPDEILFLESCWNPGERVGLDGEYGFNVYTKIPQSGGGNVHYVYMVNEFAYIFWYYIFEEKNFTYLPYFARNYNVRWLMGINVPGQTTEGMPYEVEGFDSGFVEVVNSKSILVLFIGEYSEYSRLFISVALGNPQDIVLVYGGENMDGCDLDTLRGFDVVYLSGLRCRNRENLESTSILISDYAEEGGAVVLDTGILTYGGELNSIPDPFPAELTAIYGQSHLTLSQAAPCNLTENIDFAKFATIEPYSLSYAKKVKAGASTLIYDQDRPVMVYWEQGCGKVLWIGLRLPYLAFAYQRREEVKFLINVLRFASSSKTETSKNIVNFNCPTPEEIIVHVENVTVRDAVWTKMSYYPGWRAQFEDENSAQLRIFRAGPNMMLVFPRRNGDYTVRFYFEKTWDVRIGETVSQLGAVSLLFLAFTALLKKRN